MARFDKILRVVLLVGGAALIAAAFRVVGEKKLLADATTEQIEGVVAALDPATRAAVIARLTADAAEQVKERFGH